MMNVARYWKAVLGFVTPGAVIVGSSVLAGSDGGSSITQAELITALVACVITAGGVAAVRNADPAPSPDDEGHEEPLDEKPFVG